MIIQPTPISGVAVIQAEPIADQRGSFARLYCEQELAPVLNGRGIVQINHSLTRQTGALRGLHFQYPPHAETKIVRCLRGRVFDVALDLRAGSPTFLNWYAEELSPENGKALVVPEGCAHGFQVLEADSELLYLHTEFYKRGSEGGIRFDDPLVAIDWPLHVADLSARDAGHPLLPAGFQGIIS